MRRLSICLLFGLMACCFAVTGFAKDTVLKGGTVHTVSGKVIKNGVVVIGDDGKIKTVGDASTQFDAKATVMDVTGKVVTPGFIDVHTSLGLVEIWAVKNTNDTSSGSGQVRAAAMAADGFNADSAVIPVQRQGGITDAVIVPGGGVISGQSAWVQLQGKGQHGQVVDRDVAMHIRMDESVLGAVQNSRIVLYHVLRRVFTDLAFFLKNQGKFDSNQSRKLSASRADFLALAKTQGKDALPVFLHVHRAVDIQRAVKWAMAQKLKPVIVGGAQAWRVRKMLAKLKVPVVVDPMSNLPSRFERLGSRADNAKLLQKAGVQVVISTFESHNVRKLRQLAGNAVRAGLSHAEALKSVTLNAAQAAGLDAQIGSLQKGRWGNVVVWSGDPFELSTKVETMLIRGQKVSLKSRQDALFQRYNKQLYKPVKAKP